VTAGPRGRTNDTAGPGVQPDDTAGPGGQPDETAPGRFGTARLDTGITVWFTGLPSSGKTTIASALEGRLRAAGVAVETLDGDVVRTHLTRDLGYSRDDRDENVRRVGFVAELLSRHGVVVLCSLVSPYRAARDEVRARHLGRFFEVYVSTPADVCGQRDIKGLYARARAGEVTGMTGVDDPYEPPLAPELVVPAHLQTLDESVESVWNALHN
jgi:adenylylsulfate kinase